MTDVTPIVSVLGMLGLTALIAWLALRGPRRRVERRQFTCPICGGHYWGSQEPFAVGRCAGCGFTWKRIDDDRYIGRLDR